MKSPFITCYLNLIKAITGTGLIFYPIYFSKLGTLPTLIGIIISSIFSQIGLFILCYVNKKKGPKSLAGLAKLYKTKSVRILCDLLVISKTLLVSISYFKILDPYLCNLFKTSKHIFIMFLLSILLFPLISLKKIKSLKFASLIAVSATFYLLFLVFYKMITFNTKIIISNPSSFSLKLFLKQIPFFVFSFTAHHTIITMQNDFYNKSLIFFFSVIVSATSTVAIIYSLFGIWFNKLYDISYLDFNKDCISVFPENIEYFIARFGYILLICFSIPLQLIPCRNHLIDLFSKKRRRDKNIRFFYSFGIISFVFFIYCLPINLSFFQRATGGTSSTILCFILPMILLRKVIETPKWLKISSYISVFYGIFVFTVFFWFLIE